MNIIKIISHDVTRVITDTVFVLSMYYLCISFFGIWKKKDTNIMEPSKSFALIVAAHNEEMVIQGMIRSLLLLDYPRELFDIFVIADNCTDKTAEIARKSGALVYERHDKDRRGKGFALEWMFDKIFKMEKKYDSVVIYDADNLVSKNFLKEMNKKLCEGYKVVQGYLDSKNPKDTWITASYSISFWQSNRMFQLSRQNLGLSNQLGGTGFCVDTEVLKKLGWGATCLTEDLEFSCKLVLNGEKVGWAHDAVIYDEKPLTLAQSWWQRKRWMQGFADVSGRYFLKLLKRAFVKRSFVALDCAIYCIQPFVTVLIGFSFIISGVQYGMKAFNVIANINMDYIYSLNIGMMQILIATFGTFQFIYTPIMLALDKKLDKKVFLYYLIYPIYSLTWIPISIIGIINKNDKEWSHTVHTRSMDISDLEKAN